MMPDIAVDLPVSWVSILNEWSHLNLQRFVGVNPKLWSPGGDIRQRFNRRKSAIDEIRRYQKDNSLPNEVVAASRLDVIRDRGHLTCSNHLNRLRRENPSVPRRNRRKKAPVAIQQSAPGTEAEAMEVDETEVSREVLLAAFPDPALEASGTPVAIEAINDEFISHSRRYIRSRGGKINIHEKVHQDYLKATRLRLRREFAPHII